MLKIDGVTHWSIPVNDLEESERFYRDLLGFRRCQGEGAQGHGAVVVLVEGEDAAVGRD